MLASIIRDNFPILTMYSVCKEFALRKDNLEKNLIKYNTVKGGGKGQFLFLDNFPTYNHIQNILRHFDV